MPVALALLAGGVCSPIASGRPLNAEDSAAPLSARIVIDARDVRHPVRLALLGVNHHYNRNGYGLWDAAADQAEPAVVAGARRAGVQSVRYPGGTVANLFDWKQAIGPERGCQVDGRGNSETGFPAVRGGQAWGPDEYLEFLAAIDADPFLMVPFVTETPADAASWVEYMNSPSGTAANPNGGTDWAEVRAANGHRAPYGVGRWEIGNEQHHAASRYWLSADDAIAVRQYAFGGQRQVRDEALGADCRHPLGGVPSDGSDGQVRSVVYPPVEPGSMDLEVGGQPWHPVDVLAQAGPNEFAYVLSPDTGRVRFGDGEHGAVPPAGAGLRASYTSAHAGFFAFARAMKAVDPDIDVCASWGRIAFVSVAGDRDYDCLTTHPITSFEASGTDDWSGPLEGHDRQILAADDRRAGVAGLQQALPGGTPLWVTEYSFINGDFVDFPTWATSLSHAIAIASLLEAWLELGLPWAMGDDLLWDFDRAVLGPAPDFTFTADATVRQALLPMFAAGGQVLRARVPVNPVRDPGLGDGTYPGLSVVASRGAGGDLWLMVVNRLPSASVSTQVTLRGASTAGDAVVRLVTGPDLTSWNAPGQPPAVRLQTSTRHIDGTQFRHVFGPHSVTVLRLPRG